MQVEVDSILGAEFFIAKNFRFVEQATLISHLQVTSPLLNALALNLGLCLQGCNLILPNVDPLALIEGIIGLGAKQLWIKS